MPTGTPVIAATAEASELAAAGSAEKSILSPLFLLTFSLILGFMLFPEAASLYTRSSTSSWKRIFERKGKRGESRSAKARRQRRVRP